MLKLIIAIIVTVIVRVIVNSFNASIFLYKIFW